MIFDTHTHYDDEAFDADREELLSGFAASGNYKFVNIGASMEGSRASIALSKQQDFIYASVGLHPDYAAD
ncbi:MAG: TatD family hydrolase, partial [Lachnospiraceae bacterium]|nr:TatD family hydrolase [Lachnospiraceae bacterium]